MNKKIFFIWFCCLSIIVFELNGADYASSLIEQYEKPGGLLDPAKSTEPTHEQQKAAQSWISRAASGARHYAGKALEFAVNPAGKPDYSTDVQEDYRPVETSGRIRLTEENPEEGSEQGETESDKDENEDMEKFDPLQQNQGYFKLTPEEKEHTRIIYEEIYNIYKTYGEIDNAPFPLGFISSRAEYDPGGLIFDLYQLAKITGPKKLGNLGTKVVRGGAKVTAKVFRGEADYKYGAKMAIGVVEHGAKDATKFAGETLGGVTSSFIKYMGDLYDGTDREPTTFVGRVAKTFKDAFKGKTKPAVEEVAQKLSKQGARDIMATIRLELTRSIKEYQKNHPSFDIDHFLSKDSFDKLFSGELGNIPEEVKEKLKIKVKKEVRKSYDQFKTNNTDSKVKFDPIKVIIDAFDGEFKQISTDSVKALHTMFENVFDKFEEQHSDLRADEILPTNSVAELFAEEFAKLKPGAQKLLMATVKDKMMVDKRAELTKEQYAFGVAATVTIGGTAEMIAKNSQINI